MDREQETEGEVMGGKFGVVCRVAFACHDLMWLHLSMKTCELRASEKRV